MRRHAMATSSGTVNRLGARSIHWLAGVVLAAAFVLVVSGSAFAAVPDVKSVFVSAVTKSSASLEAVVGPEGEATTYHFEYGPADCSANPCTNVPLSDASAGSGATPVRVAREANGLTPGLKYHYRVVATNGMGTASSTDHTFITYPAGAKTSCSNEAFRIGASAALPDCRAYEMVSPVDKNGGDVATACDAKCWRTALNQASVLGGKITYSSATGFGDQTGGLYSNQYLATRTAKGWSTHGINPPHRAGLFPAINQQNDTQILFKAFTPDLSSAWLLNDSVDPLTADALGGHVNLYRRYNGPESYEALTNSEPTIPGASIQLGRQAMQFLGYSADGNSAVFSAGEPLTANANPAHPNAQLYDFSEGELHLVSVLPNGMANPGSSYLGTQQGGPSGATVNQGQDTLENAISDDGSRIFWTGKSTSSQGLGPIYLRENPTQPQSALDGGGQCEEPEKACTVPVSTGNAQFWSATPDASKAIFTEGKTLYEYDVEAGTTNQIAGEVTGLLGSSDDLKYVYFVSSASLATGATAGANNLYLHHDGSTSFVAELSSADVTPTLSGSPYVTSPRAVEHNVRVTPDGHHLAFMSSSRGLSEQVAEYDNTDAVNGEPDREIYVYTADGPLVCASCNPGGARPRGGELKAPYGRIGGSFYNTGVWAAAWLSTAPNSLYFPKAFSTAGDRLFFNSFDELVPTDTNGAQDVYQWEASGTGNCVHGGPGFSERNQGCIDLISTGQGTEDSEFVDATPSGGEVFFETSNSLLPQDPGLIDIYAASIGGGFPPPARPPASCEGEACQSQPAAPDDPTPASLTFRGAGNVVEKPKAKKKKKKRHPHKRHHRRAKKHRRAVHADPREHR